jgi:aldehyde dehydrogenase (NAD(P)+)
MAAAATLTLPNGNQYEQPTGLFINNSFVEASGELLDVVDPA